MTSLSRAFSERVTLPFIFGLTGLSLVAQLFGRGGAAAVCGLLALIAVAVLSPRRIPKILALALLTFVFSIGFKSGGSVDLFFIGLLGILLVLIRTKETPVWIKVLFGGAILLVAIPLAGFANTFLFELGIQIGIYAAMSLGLNVVVGMAGLLDLGYAAFFAIGAYTWAIFGSPQAHNFMRGNFPLNGQLMFVFMLVAICTTAITGIVIGLPALRLKGDYLAIVTLGLGEMIRVLANNLDHPANITNGPQGITPISRPPIGWFRAAASFIQIS